MNDNTQNRKSAGGAVRKTTWGCIIIGGGVLLLFFIFAAITITGFISMQDRAKEVAVRRNMGEIQRRVEQYSQSHKGYFPSVIDSSLLNGIAFENPYKLSKPFIVTMTDTITMKTTLLQGQIAYMPLDITARGAKHYYILGKSTKENKMMKYRLYSR